MTFDRASPKTIPTSCGFDTFDKLSTGESHPYNNSVFLKDEGIVTGASIPPGFAPALAELERGSN